METKRKEQEKFMVVKALNGWFISKSVPCPAGQFIEDTSFVATEIEDLLDAVEEIANQIEIEETRRNLAAAKWPEENDKATLASIHAIPKTPKDN